ncbi:hypothetical protein GCM10010149_54980 [Nonomuraea roseoviolacea subsp. roseoviolacea]
MPSALVETEGAVVVVAEAGRAISGLRKAVEPRTTAVTLEATDSHRGR